jgi:succinate dehydrogenase / fumarate reductase cytochrome b subunit
LRRTVARDLATSEGKAMTTVVLNFWSTSVGKKMVMALTGMVLFGFVFGHMLGNLQLYSGPEALNAYGAFLHSKPALLWVVRLVLLSAVALHMLSALQLWLQSQDARPVGYRKQIFRETSYAARTMVVGGPIIAAFVIYHLAHLTTGNSHGSFQKGEVYANVVSGFQVWWASAAYIVAMLFLGLHLYHGVWSMLQTLGAEHSKYNAIRRSAAIAFAVVVAGVNISFPVSVLTGLVS